jgi:aspartate/methionine/tyrosine aminotransferase
MAVPVPMSATLAANELIARKRAAGEPVLPLGFGEAGLPPHPLLRAALAGAAGSNSYGPVAGRPELRAAAAGYWARRGLPTTASQVVCGPAVCQAVAGRLRAAGLAVPEPQAAFYLYPDFAPWAGELARRGVTTGPALAGYLLAGYALVVLPASAFGEEAAALRARVATALLYGDTDEQREQALASPDPVSLPWIAALLQRLEEILADLAPSQRPAAAAGENPR